MFERAVFRRSDEKLDFHLDVGQLAETILYYGNVDLLLDRGNLGQLLKTIGPDALIRLVRLPTVNAVFVADDLATLSNNYGFTAHKFIAFSLSRTSENKNILTKKEHVRECFQRTLGKSWRSRKQADFISQFLSEASFGDGLAGPSLVESAKADIFDPNFTREAVRLIIEEKIPTANLPENFRFEPVKFKDEFIIDTNLDFNKLSLEYGKYWPKTHSTLSPALILSEILQAKASLGLSAAFDADVLTTSIASKIMDLKVAEVSMRTTSSRHKMTEFSEWALQGKSIAGALHNGERSFHEFLDIAERSGEFKKWVLGIEKDKSLAKEYFQEVGSSGWLDRLPNKTLRYMAFTGASAAVSFVSTPIVGIAAAAGLTAVDSFLLDRLIGGWKPSHFIDNRVKTFVK
jgi:hypothetical protein